MGKNVKPRKLRAEGAYNFLNIGKNNRTFKKGLGKNNRNTCRIYTSASSPRASFLPALGQVKRKRNLSLTFSRKRNHFPPELTTGSMSRASHWILSTTP